ncbi:P-loop NTPase fold protein [Methylovorus sp. MP688]|uniref:P-loop NTPase fold protein n=1 Tax=Methylovorus sp. (strain MP688) TaxID=887061 RepID=UPI0006767422|nr:P-loop NTPase fold protein [Methylovorus sp. MP688]
MSDINKLIKEYIESYCEKKEAPGYAILIKGKWGTGKTWFIKKIKNDLEGKRLKLIHISVYGMGSISEIDNELYRAVHPILGSKKMVLAGKLFKGFIKTSIHVDLDLC